MRREEVTLKLAIEMGGARERINAIADFGAIQQYGVKGEGSEAAKTPSVLAELAVLVASGDLEVPIAASFLLEQLRAAFKQPQKGHTRGKCWYPDVGR
jgi:NADPH:quinone reductase-like Zn-dependent oxidoreductase